MRPAQEHKNSLQGAREYIWDCEIGSGVMCESPSQLSCSVWVTLGVSSGPIEE